MVVFPENLVAHPDGPLYPGSEESQSERFSHMLAIVLKAHKKEVNEMGYNIWEIGVHSIRKGAATTFISHQAAPLLPLLLVCQLICKVDGACWAV